MIGDTHAMHLRTPEARLNLDRRGRACFCVCGMVIEVFKYFGVEETPKHDD